jgi:hypothetical protein
VEWCGTWWPGQIIEKEGSNVKVNYVDWDSSYDEWIQARSVRLGNVVLYK